MGSRQYRRIRKRSAIGAFLCSGNGDDLIQRLRAARIPAAHIAQQTRDQQTLFVHAPGRGLVVHRQGQATQVGERAGQPPRLVQLPLAPVAATPVRPSPPGPGTSSGADRARLSPRRWRQAAQGRIRAPSPSCRIAPRRAPDRAAAPQGSWRPATPTNPADRPAAAASCARRRPCTRPPRHPAYSRRQTPPDGETAPARRDAAVRGPNRGSGAASAGARADRPRPRNERTSSSLERAGNLVAVERNRRRMPEWHASCIAEYRCLTSVPRSCDPSCTGSVLIDWIFVPIWDRTPGSQDATGGLGRGSGTVRPTQCACTPCMTQTRKEHRSRIDPVPS